MVRHSCSVADSVSGIVSDTTKLNAAIAAMYHEMDIALRADARPYRDVATQPTGSTVHRDSTGRRFIV